MRAEIAETEPWDLGDSQARETGSSSSCSPLPHTGQLRGVMAMQLEAQPCLCVGFSDPAQDLVDIHPHSHQLSPGFPGGKA